MIYFSEEEFLCPVCQGGEEELDSFAKLAECEHVFCEPCITEWSKNADTCPICRNRFVVCNIIINGFNNSRYKGRTNNKGISDTNKYLLGF